MEIVKGGDYGSLKEADIRKNIEYLRSIAYTMSFGHDIRKEMKNVLEIFAGAKHRVLRLLCYPILKEYADLDYSDLQEVIAADITSNDPEIQLNAIKLLYNFPVNKQLELFKSHEKDFLKLLIVPEYQYEKLTCLNDFLLKCLITSFLKDNNENDRIYEFYVKISELVFHSSREFSATAIYIMKSVYSQYIQSSFDISRQDQFFDGNGSFDQIIKPLIIQLTNSLFPEYNKILTVISGYEIRSRANLLSFAVLLLEAALKLLSENYYISGSDLLVDIGKKNLQFEMQGNVVMPLKLIVQSLIKEHLLKDLEFPSYELDVWIPTFTNLFKVLKLVELKDWRWVLPHEERCEIIKVMFSIFSQNIQKIHYKRDLNVILLNFANVISSQNNSYRLTQSMKLLEFGEKFVQNSIDRLLLYLVSLINIVIASLELVEEGQKSVIFGLFQQGWFLFRIQDKEDKNSVRFKEEFLISLIQSFIFIQSNQFIKQKAFESYPTILMEVLDLATRIIDWKMDYKKYNEHDKTSYLHTLDLYFVLLESLFGFVENADAQNHINELIKRVNAKELAFDVKLKVLNAITKKISPEMLSRVNLQEIFNEFQGALINNKFSVILEEQFIQNLSGPSLIKTLVLQIELMIDILYYCSFKTSDKNTIINLLSEYEEFLNKVMKSPKIYKPLVESISEYVELITRYIMNEEEVNVSEIKISINSLNQIEFAKDEDYDESDKFKSFTNLSYAFNLYYMKNSYVNEVFDSDTLENGNPIENLLVLWSKGSNKKEMNFRSTEPKLISGIGDIIQIRSQHAINAAYSLISVNLHLINLNRFVVERVKISPLYPNNLELYPEVSKPKFYFIESFNPNEVQNVSFSFFVKRAVTINIAFEVSVEIGEIDHPVRFKTLPYSISFLELTVPNYMMASHRMLFENIWQNIPYNYSLKCKLMTTEKKLLDAFGKIKLYVSTFGAAQQEKWKKAYILGYTWDNNTIGIIVTNETFEMATSPPKFTIDIRTSNMEIIENIKEDENSFISILSQGNLEFLY